MGPLARAWKEVLEKRYVRLESAVPVWQNGEGLLLVQNVGSMAEPLVGISLKLESTQAGIEDLVTETKGFSLFKQDFVYEGRIGTYAVLQCARPAFNDHFMRFAEKLVEDCGGEVRPSVALKNFTRRWMEFFSRVPSHRLSDEEIKGLYGELALLRDLITEHGVSVEVVRAWEGPEARAWDFLLDLPGKRLQLEVKTTDQSYDRAYIHGIRQLEANALVVSYLCLQRIHFTKVQRPAESHTLVDLVDQLRELLAPDPVALGAFEEGLSTVVVLDDDHRAHCRLALIQERARQWYAVDESFPGLTSHNLPDAVRQRIGKVSYELDLADLPFTKGTLPFGETDE